MQEIRKGLDAGVLREIFIGLENGLDVPGYANTEYNWQQMKEIRLGLEAGLDVSYYRSPMYTAHEMCKRRIFMEENPDIVCNLETQELSPEEMFPDSQTAWRWHSGLQGC